MMMKKHNLGHLIHSTKMNKQMATDNGMEIASNEETITKKQDNDHGGEDKIARLIIL